MAVCLDRALPVRAGSVGLAAYARRVTRGPGHNGFPGVPRGFFIGAGHVMALRPDLYPWTSTPRMLLNGEEVETRVRSQWIEAYRLHVHVGLDEDETQYVAVGQYRRLVPLADVVAYAATRGGLAVAQAARQWPVVRP